MTDIHDPQSQWQALIQRSFLSLYKAADVEAEDSAEFQGYDFTFEFEEATLYLLVCDQAIDSEVLSVDKLRFDAARKEMVNQLIKRHNQLYQKRINQVGSNNVSLVPNFAVAKPHYFVAITSLSLSHKQDSYVIEHQFGSQYFAEQCVLDLDDAHKVLQIFSLADFTRFLETLATPSDFLAFLQFHRDKLVSMTPFHNEKALLAQFLCSTSYYQRVINVQQQLMDIGLLDQIEPRLVELSQPQSDATKKAEALSAHLLKNSKMWYTLVNGLTKRRFSQGDMLPIEQVQKLIGESMYTRTCIMEEIMDYAHVSSEERQQGYVRHQHSYNAFGRHYMLVFYAQDMTSPLSAESVRANHQDMLFELNSQLQAPPMTDLFILGFDFNHHDDKGQTEVRMDAFYQAGSVVTANMQRLYEQIAELKAANK